MLSCISKSGRAAGNRWAGGPGCPGVLGIGPGFAFSRVQQSRFQTAPRLDAVLRLHRRPMECRGKSVPHARSVQARCQVDRGQPPGRYEVDEIRAYPFLSEQTSRASVSGSCIRPEVTEGLRRRRTAYPVVVRNPMTRRTHPEGSGTALLYVT